MEASDLCLLVDAAMVAMVDLKSKNKEAAEAVRGVYDVLILDLGSDTDLIRMLRAPSSAISSKLFATWKVSVLHRFEKRRDSFTPDSLTTKIVENTYEQFLISLRNAETLLLLTLSLPKLWKIRTSTLSFSKWEVQLFTYGTKF
jgi:hypothetical protein